MSKRKNSLFPGMVLAALALLCAGTVRVKAAHVERLRCEYLVNPLGIHEAAPRLSWVMASGRRGERQTAYQVLVASTPELLAHGNGDLWDSGKVTSDESAHVEYAGKPLASRTRCFWKVQVWDRQMHASVGSTSSVSASPGLRGVWPWISDAELNCWAACGPL